jgi:phosphoglycolate phosphatase-like HAD superfamily hydrolase
VVCSRRSFRVRGGSDYFGGMPETRPFAVLFDLDGTLIDSIALLLASMKHTFHGRPRQPSDDEWIQGLGTPLPKQLTPYVESDEDRERRNTRGSSIRWRFCTSAVIRWES